MKKIMIALALVGMSYFSAEAQTKSSETKKTCTCPAMAKQAKATGVAHTHKHTGTTKSGDTYQVCRQNGAHYDCCTHHKTVTTKTVATPVAAK